MPTLQPIYTANNCTFCCPLQWGLTVFWRSPVSEAPWYTELARATETDGIRLLNQRFSLPGISQFAVSTGPGVARCLLVQRVKGRLQHLVRSTLPRALQANYGLRSFGHVTRAVTENYVASQLEHHEMADPRVQALLERYQIVRPEVDLSQPRCTSHGRYWYNLHLVLVHRERWTEVREEVIRQVHDMILRVCQSKSFQLSRAGLLADHVHLLLGCPLEMAPAELALAFLNNLAYAHGMRAVYQFGAYIGTVGEYDQGAVAGDEQPEQPEQETAAESK